MGYAINIFSKILKLNLHLPFYYRYMYPGESSYSLERLYRSVLGGEYKVHNARFQVASLSEILRLNNIKRSKLRRFSMPFNWTEVYSSVSVDNKRRKSCNWYTGPPGCICTSLVKIYFHFYFNLGAYFWWYYRRKFILSASFIISIVFRYYFLFSYYSWGA